MLKPNLKVLQEKATAPHAIISRYQGSLPTLLGIHQPLLGRRALKKSSQLLFVTKCTMLHFVREKRTVVKESRERLLWLFQHAVKETTPHPCHCRMIVHEVKEWRRLLVVRSIDFLPDHERDAVIICIQTLQILVFKNAIF